MGWALSRFRAAFRSAMSRKTWLPVSAQEWAASAVMDAEPEISAATVLAAATRTFAAKAISTVSDADQDFLRFTPFSSLGCRMHARDYAISPGCPGPAFDADWFHSCR